MPDELSPENLHFTLGNETGNKQDTIYIPYSERVVEALILSVICIASITGNVSLWLVVCMSRDLRTLSNSLVLCLSAADLTVSTVNMPVTVCTIFYGDWVFSTTTCIAVGYVNMVTFIASVMSLAAISINRYIVICRSGQRKNLITRRNTVVAIAGVWLLSMLLAFPPLIGWAEYDYLPGQSFCFCKWKTSVTYTFFMVGMCFGGPCTAMTFAYVYIIGNVKASRKRMLQFAVQNTACRGENGERRSLDGQSINKKHSCFESSLCNCVSLLFTHIEDRRHFSVNSKTRPIELRTSRDEFVLSRRPELPIILENTEYTANTSAGVINRAVDIDRPTVDLPHPSASASASNSEFSSPNNITKSPTNDTSGVTPHSRETYIIRENKFALRRRQEELRLSASLLVVIVIFVIAWFPFCLAMVWSAFSSSVIPRPLDMFTLLLGYLNSCCNPVVYGVMNTRFRQGFFRLYGCIFRGKNRRVGLHSDAVDYSFSIA